MYVELIVLLPSCWWTMKFQYMLTSAFVKDICHSQEITACGNLSKFKSAGLRFLPIS